MNQFRHFNRKATENSYIFNHLCNVTCNRLKVTGLPEEIDNHFFRYNILLFGRLLFFKYNNQYHVFPFSQNASYDEYYIPTEFLVTNPYMKPAFTTNKFDLSNASIIFSDINAYLDNTDTGLYDFLIHYSNLVMQIDNSILAISKNAKLIAFLTGSTRSFVESAKIAINRVFNGDDTIAIMEESLVDSIKVNPISEKMDYKLSELIKTRQYYLSDFYQRIGIATNQNMKKERLTDDESQLISNVADVDFDSIINYINESLEKVNNKFNLNISVKLNEPDPPKEEVYSSTQSEKEDDKDDTEVEDT